MDKPVFKNGSYIIKDYSGRDVELTERAWKHITKEKGRDYFERFFDKIVKTLRKPSAVKKSSKITNVVIYERFFDDFYITHSVLGRAFVNVVVNWETRRVLTAYPSIKRKKGRILWPRKR